MGDKRAEALEKLRNWTERQDVPFPAPHQASMSVEHLWHLDDMITQLAQEVVQNAAFLTEDGVLPEHMRERYQLACAILGYEPKLLGEEDENVSE